MKPFLLILFIIFGNSCGQEENVSPFTNQIDETVNNNGETSINPEQLLGPNEIMLSITIVEANGESKEICGLSKEFVYHVEVIEVLKIGGSVNHKFSANEKMDVAFLFQPEGLSAGMNLEVKARESLCPDSSDSYFTIIEHRILE